MFFVFILKYFPVETTNIAYSYKYGSQFVYITNYIFVQHIVVIVVNIFYNSNIKYRYCWTCENTGSMRVRQLKN